MGVKFEGFDARDSYSLAMQMNSWVKEREDKITVIDMQFSSNESVGGSHSYFSSNSEVHAILIYRENFEYPDCPPIDLD